MFDEDMLAYTLKNTEKSNVSFSSVRGELHRVTNYLLRNGVLETSTFSIDAGYNVKVIVDGSIGFVSTDRWTKSESDNVVDDAIKNGRSGKRKNKITFEPEKSIVDNWEVKEKKKVDDIPKEDVVKSLIDIDKALTDTKLNMPGRILMFSVDHVNKVILNSYQSAIRSEYTKISMFGYITLTENNESKQFYKMYGYTGGLEGLDRWNVIEDLKNECMIQKKIISSGVSLEPGEYTLVCGPEVSGITAHESCGHPMEADRILGRELSQAGGSFITLDMLNTTIGSEYATVIDDPTIPNSYGYYKYDDEGVTARRRYLYKNGKINEFLQNRESGSKSHSSSNGSSRALSYDVEDIVRMANTYIAPGDWKKDEIIKNVKKGVYMKSFTEWNIDDKRYNQKYVAREAYLIRNGEICEPLKRCVLEITTPKYWQSIDAVSNDLEWSAATCGKGDPEQGVPVFTGGPTIRLKGVYLYG